MTDGRWPGLALAAAAAAAGGLLVVAAARITTAMEPSGPRRAAALAQVWARHVGASDRTLDVAGDMALGDSGLTYIQDSDTLVGRVWINMALIRDMTEDEIATQRRMAAALNNPAIGGMYDHGGGRFVLDEAREGYFLTREFPVAQTTPDSLLHDMERMRTVAATWTTKWFFKVAMVMHGKEKAPTRPERLDDVTQQ